MRRQLNTEARARITAILTPQADIERPGVLPNEMNPRNPEQAIERLRALLQGMNTED
jgi:hypothetical protein